MIIQFPNNKISKIRNLLTKTENLVTSLNDAKTFFLHCSTKQEFYRCLKNCQEIIEELNYAISSNNSGIVSDDDMSFYDVYVNGMQITVNSINVHVKHFF
jgi:flagellin-specific chaperone FliS